MIKFEYPEGTTPIHDVSGLKLPWVKTQAKLLNYYSHLDEFDKQYFL
ncbi:MAG: hypothetical protein WC688_05300 [Parachlamydiales bacterium]|jgi:hypothetical protein